MWLGDKDFLSLIDKAIQYTKAYNIYTIFIIKLKYQGREVAFEKKVKHRARYTCTHSLQKALDMEINVGKGPRYGSPLGLSPYAGNTAYCCRSTTGYYGHAQMAAGQDSQKGSISCPFGSFYN